MESVGSSTTSWYGLHLLDTANTGVVQHAHIEEATYGIRTAASAINPIRDVRLERNGTAGIYATAGQPLVERASITGASYGVWITGDTSPDIDDTLIYDTSSIGVYVNTTGSPAVDLDNVTVHSANSTGIYVSPSSGSPSVTVTNSVVTQNNGYGVRKLGSGTTTVSYSDVWDNSSGSFSGVVQGSGILSENPLYADPPQRLRPHLLVARPLRGQRRGRHRRAALRRDADRRAAGHLVGGPAARRRQQPLHADRRHHPA